MKHRVKRKSVENALVFRKWGRKSYSLFSSLKKVVIISVLSVAYFISVPVSAVAISNDTTEIKIQYDLDEVEVTASRVPVLFSQVARVLTVIESQEIERMPAQSVQDLLEYVAGVDIRQRGAEGVQADVSIRGGTFDQILILLNGINITDPQTGHHNLNLPVSLSQIERIEILEGPAARVYGPNAFSGAINIITRTPALKSLGAEVSTGSFGYLNTDLSGSFRTGKLNHYIAAFRKSSKGYTENTDFRSLNAYYSGQHLSSAGKLFYQGGISGKGFGANSFYTPVYPNQYEEVQVMFGSIKLESYTKINLTPSVYWRRHSDKFMLFRNNAPSWYKNHNYHRTDVWGADINSWLLWKGGKTSFGAGYRSESILSNVLGELMEERKDFPGKDKFFTHSKERKIISVFAEHGFFLNKWRLNTGVLANHISDREGGIKLFPGIDLSYQINKPLKFVASWNTSLRMPTFTDLYYKGPTNLGNPDLKPENSTSVEGGVKMNSKALNGHVVLFHRKGTNLIDWIKAEDDELWKAMNHTVLKSQGVEVNLFWLPDVHLNKSLPDKIGFSYLFNQQQKEESPFISYYVLDNLRHKFVTSYSQRILKIFSFDVRAIYQDREGTFSYYGGESYTNELEYKPFWIIDLKAACKFRNFDFFVSANNLFNRQYYDLGNVIQPGRWIKTGISFTTGTNE